MSTAFATPDSPTCKLASAAALVDSGKSIVATLPAPGATRRSPQSPPAQPQVSQWDESPPEGSRGPGCWRRTAHALGPCCGPTARDKQRVFADQSHAAQTSVDFLLRRLRRRPGDDAPQKCTLTPPSLFMGRRRCAHEWQTHGVCLDTLCLPESIAIRSALQLLQRR